MLNTYVLARKKLPKWLRNICRKKNVLNLSEKEAH